MSEPSHEAGNRTVFHLSATDLSVPGAHAFANHVRSSRFGRDEKGVLNKMMITTEKLWINDTVRRTDDAKEIVREFAESVGLSSKNELHLELLMEETLGMMLAKVETFEGEIWLEGTGEACSIILEATAREAGKDFDFARPAPAGFMAKIADVLECTYRFEDIESVPDAMKPMLPAFFLEGMDGAENEPVYAGQWSLSTYRHALKQGKGSDTAADELEKSIVAQLADDVRIGIDGKKIRMVISKRFA